MARSTIEKADCQLARPDFGIVRIFKKMYHYWTPKARRLNSIDENPRKNRHDNTTL
uniref:Uncharacterized protein n=1 Tax=Acrobeloides nanus TaxID=290746 RepID=A0A914CWE7_9BILA